MNIDEMTKKFFEKYCESLQTALALCGSRWRHIAAAVSTDKVLYC